MKKMMNSPEINIFIENTYSDFEDNPEFELENYVKNARLMFERILKNEVWLKNSCLSNQTFNSIYLDIVFVDDDKIHDINRSYRDKDCATDVISFALFADSPENERFVFDNEINLGEIIISLDTTKKQAVENAKTFSEELYFLIAHGLLHLLGYDHLTDETLEEMWSIQLDLVESLSKETL